MSTPLPYEAETPEPLSRSIVRGWNRFWFTPADPTSLAFTRICAGLVVLYLHIAYCFDLQAFFGRDAWVPLEDLNDYRANAPWFLRPDDAFRDLPEYQPPNGPDMAAQQEYMRRWGGVHPDLTFAKGYPAWSIWFHVTDPTWMAILHGLHLLIFFFLVIGFCTRVTSALAWLAAMSYIQRSQNTLFGMDTILNFTLLYLMIGPSGAALSVDRLIARYWRAWRVLRSRTSARKGGDTALASLHDDRPRPSVSANLAVRLLQVHICIVYGVSGLTKLQGAAWWMGTATWMTMINYEFSPVHYPFYLNWVRYLCNHRWLWELVMASGVLFTLLFEIGFPVLVWNRYLRWTMVISSVLLHTGIAFFMGLTTFSLMMVSAVTCFIPVDSLRRFLRWLGCGPGGYRLAFAGRDRRQVRAASLVHAFDVWDQIALTDPAASSADRLQLRTEKGDMLTGYPLFERVVRALRLLWPAGLLTLVPGAAALGRAWYPGEEPAAPRFRGAHDEKAEKVTS